MVAYIEKTKLALIEIDKQVGGLKVDCKGIAYRGLLIRHLVLLGWLEETKKVLKFIKDNLSKGILLNLMDQYYPSY